MSESIHAEKKVVLLLSGGIDSFVLGAFANSFGALKGTMFVDYGQPAIIRERAAVALFSEAQSEPRPVRFEQGVRMFNIGTMGDTPGVPGPRVVPMRNLVLISLAANAAQSIGATHVWLGATADDAELYADCRAGWITATSVVTELACGIVVEAPFSGLTKSEVVSLGRGLGVDLDQSWSCYSPKFGEACGSCDACRARTAALEEVD